MLHCATLLGERERQRERGGGVRGRVGVRETEG